MEKNEVRLFVCDCGCGGLSIERDSDFPEIFISTWRYGTSIKVSFIDRLRYCWDILRYGRPHTDEVIFNIETAKAFLSELERCIEDENASRP